MKDFFLKVWAKNVGVHHTRQNTVIALTAPTLKHMCSAELNHTTALGELLAAITELC